MDKRFKWPFNQKRNNYLDQPPPHARGYHPLYNKSYSRLQNYPNYKFSNHNASGGGKVYYNQQPPPPSIYAREASGGGGGGGWLAPAPPVADSGYSSNNNSSTTNSSSDVVTMIVENNNLKKMIVLHLNLMQEQTDSLTAKDKELYEQNGRIKTLLSQNQELMQQIDKLGQRIEDLRNQLRRRAERDDVEVPKAKVHCYADKETQTIELAPPLQEELKEQEPIKSHLHGYPQKSIKQSQNVPVLVTSVTDLPPTTPILDSSKGRDKFNCGKKVSTIFLHRVHQEKTKFQKSDELEDQQQQQEEEQREEILEEDVEVDDMQINMEDEEHIYHDALETHEMEVVTETIIGAEEELGAEEETVDDVDPVNNGHIYEDDEEEEESDEDEDDDEEEEEDDEEEDEEEDDEKEELQQEEEEQQQQEEEEELQEEEDLKVEQEIITNNLWQPNDEPHEEIVEEETEKGDQKQGQLYVTDVDNQSLDTPFAHSTPQLQEKIFNETFNEKKHKKAKSSMQKWREEQEQQKLIEKECLQLRKEHKVESTMKDSQVQTVEMMHTEVQTEDEVQMEEIEMETEVELTPTKVHKKHKGARITKTAMSAKSIVTATKTTVQKMPVVANHHQASTTTKLRPNQHVDFPTKERIGAMVKIAGKVKDLLGLKRELLKQKKNKEMDEMMKRADEQLLDYEEWVSRGMEENLERELQRESDEMREKELELERELQREEELRREREEKKEREKEQEREQQKEREREQQKEREREQQKEREREQQKEREREQQKEREREQQKERELEQQKEREREQQKEREREKQKERELEKEQEREQKKQRELEQMKEQEQELQKSQEREQQAAAKAKEAEENKEREQQKERERKQREQRKREKETEQLKQKPKEEDKEPQTDHKQEEEGEKLPKEEEPNIEEEAMRKLHEHLQRQQQRLQNQPQQQLPYVRLKKSPMQTSLIYPPIAPTTTTAISTQLTPAPTPSPTNVASAVTSSPKPKVVNNNNNNNYNNSKTLVEALIQYVHKPSPESNKSVNTNSSSSTRSSTSASASTSTKRLSRFRTSVQLYTTRSWEDQEFHCDNEFFLEEADELLADNPSLEIPKWKVVNIRRSPESKGTEALSDADFERRHEKDVRDEIERKKRDARYLREQQRSDTLRMRHNQDEVLVPLDPLPTSTFYPLPMDIEGIEFVSEVPVQAFGENVVNIQVQNDDFTLPWVEAATATTDIAKAKAEAVPVATLASKKLPTTAAESRHQEMNSSYVFLKRRKRQRRR